MNAEIMNPFLGAIDHTFKSFGIDWGREALALIVPPLQLDGVTVDVGVVGDVKGKFFFSCPQKTALFLANKLCVSMGLAESEEFGEMEHSAFSEISNMMGGTAATNFSLIGKSVNISPPSIIEGSQIIATVFTRQILKISLVIEGNPAHLFLAVQ